LIYSAVLTRSSDVSGLSSESSSSSDNWTKLTIFSSPSPLSAGVSYPDSS